MHWLNDQGWPLGERSWASIECVDSLKEMVDFGDLLKMVDSSLEPAIRSVVKKMVAKGIRMHEPNKQEDWTSKGGNDVNGGAEA